MILCRHFDVPINTCYSYTASYLLPCQVGRIASWRLQRSSGWRSICVYRPGSRPRKTSAGNCWPLRVATTGTWLRFLRTPDSVAPKDGTSGPVSTAFSRRQRARKSTSWSVDRLGRWDLLGSERCPTLVAPAPPLPFQVRLPMGGSVAFVLTGGAAVPLFNGATPHNGFMVQSNIEGGGPPCWVNDNRPGQNEPPKWVSRREWRRILHHVRYASGIQADRAGQHRVRRRPRRDQCFSKLGAGRSPPIRYRTASGTAMLAVDN